MDTVSAVTNSYTGIMSKHSSSFQTFILSLGEARSKAEEDRIVREVLVQIKNNIKKPDITIKQKKEQLVQLIYCSMLGHDVSFSHIDTVNFIQQPKYIHLAEKRIGYAALLVFCDDTYEMECTMNMNNMIKDLNSNQSTEICFALNAASQLIFKEMLPPILPLVLRLVTHSDEVVRSKAVMTLFKFYQLDPIENSNLKKIFYESLRDPSAGVMSVMLNIFHTLILEDGVESYKNLTSTFVCLLKQVLNFQVSPRDLNYKKVPAPWVQIKLLQILGLLGRGNLEESQKMYEMLKTCLNATNTSVPIYCAIAAECLKTVSKIYPHELLIEMAVVKAGSFLVSQNYNLKYLGITALQDLVQINASHASKYQMEIINCLNDQDETLKWKALGLLYEMASVTNVALICEKMIKYLRSTVDEFIRIELVAKITDLAEKYAPDNEWYIETMNEVFEIGGDLVSNETVYNMMLLLGEGLDSDTETDDLRRHAVISYVELIKKPILPDILIQLICWVIGEYMSIIESYDISETIQNLYKLLERDLSDSETKTWIVSAIVKLLSQQKNWEDCLQSVNQFSMSNHAEATYHEMVAALRLYDSEKIFPYDESCDEVDFDRMFVAIDNHVNNALANGMKPYCEESKREKLQPSEEDDGKLTRDSGLKFVHVQHDFSEDSNIQLGNSPAEITPTKKERRTVPGRVKVWGVSGRISENNSTNASEVDDKSSTDNLSSENKSQSTEDVDEKIKQNTLVTDSNKKLTKNQIEAEALFAGIDMKIDKSKQRNFISNAKRADKAAIKKRRKVDLINMVDNTLPNIDVPQNTQDIQNKVQIIDLETKPEEINMDNLVGIKENSDLLTGDDIFDDLNFHDMSLETNKNKDKYNTERTNNSIFSQPVDLSTDIQTTISTESNNLITHAFTDVGDMKNDGGNMLDSSSSHIGHIEEINTDVNDSFFDDMDFPPIDDENTEMSNQVTHESIKTKTDDFEATPISTQFSFIENKQSSMEIPEFLKIYPASKEKINLSGDNSFRVTCQFVFKPESTVIVLFLLNQTVQTVSDVKLSIKPPTNLTPTEDSSLTREMLSLEAMTSFHHVITVTLNHPALNMELSGHVTYKDFRNAEKRIYLQHKLAFNVLLRAITLTRENYEQKWLVKSLYEKREKLNVKTKVKALLRVIEEKCFIYPVQVIGQEIIASTSVLNAHEILLYISAKDNLHICVKSSSKQMNNCIVKMLTSAISNSL